MGIKEEFVPDTVYIHDEIIHTCNAANVVLPLVLNLFQVNSIIDIGCGIGTWLNIAKERGVKDILGVDGDYVDRKMLLISEREFLPHDLTKKLDLNRKYDLCICLEVAEHLPEETADVLIDTILQHAEVILFSAAIPGQGGQLHVNEQWPDYWKKKFEAKNYVMKDFFRPKIWMNEQVDRWYRQNLFLVTKNDHQLSLLDTPEILPLVHPDVFKAVNEQHLKKIQQLRATIETLKGRYFPALIKGFFKRL